MISLLFFYTCVMMQSCPYCSQEKLSWLQRRWCWWISADGWC